MRLRNYTESHSHLLNGPTPIHYEFESQLFEKEIIATWVTVFFKMDVTHFEDGVDCFESLQTIAFVSTEMM